MAPNPSFGNAAVLNNLIKEEEEKDRREEEKKAEQQGSEFRNLAQLSGSDLA
jgi:hypothetical protein